MVIDSVAPASASAFCSAEGGLQPTRQICRLAVDHHNDLAFQRNVRQLGRIEVVVLGFRPIDALPDEDERRSYRLRLAAARAERGIAPQNQRFLTSQLTNVIENCAARTRVISNSTGWSKVFYLLNFR